MARINLRKLTPEIRKKYKAYNNALKLDLIKNPEKDRKGEPKDEINVIVGDDKQPDRFYPQVKICRWSNEVNFSLRLKEDDKEEPIIDFDRHKVLYKKNKKECHFYEIEPNEKLREGGYEFEVILKEKPSTNKIEFTINTKRLKFYYQPPLTEEITEEQKKKGWTATETEIRDEKGRRVCYRPENIVGSYAVYHESKGGAVEKNDKDYKVGKVGHIYRPKIVDAKGNWVWGRLNIDEERGILSVEIPQEFLDNAVYPIRHAAGLTFGYTTIGGSSVSLYLYGAYRSKYTVGSQGGTVESMTMALKNGQGNRNNDIAGAIYSGNSPINNGISPTITVLTTTTLQWFTIDYTNQPSISANTDYYLAADGKNNYGSYSHGPYLAYDTGGDPDEASDNATENAIVFPNPWSADYTFTRNFSIYCTYTAGGQSVTVTDSGQGQEAVSVVKKISLIDSGQGQESVASLGKIGISDIGEGQDEALLKLTKSILEQGSGQEVVGLMAKILISDSAVGQEFLNILRKIALTETGTSQEALNILVRLALTETGIGQEAVSVLGKIFVEDAGIGEEVVSMLIKTKMSDLGQGEEVVSLLKKIMVADEGVAQEVLGVLVKLILQDSGVGTDLVEKGIISASKLVSDAGTGLEAIKITNKIQLEDGGIGQEALKILVKLAISDEGYAQEALKILNKLMVLDEGGGQDKVGVFVGVLCEEIGLGADNVGVRALIPLQDWGWAEDFVNVLAKIKMQDVGEGVDVVSVKGGVLITEAGIGSEVLKVVSKLLVEDFGEGEEVLNILANIFVADEGVGLEEILTKSGIKIEDFGQGKDEVFKKLLILHELVKRVGVVLYQAKENIVLFNAKYIAKIKPGARKQKLKEAKQKVKLKQPKQKL